MIQFLIQNGKPRCYFSGLFCQCILWPINILMFILNKIWEIYHGKADFKLLFHWKMLFALSAFSYFQYLIFSKKLMQLSAFQFLDFHFSEKMLSALSAFSYFQCLFFPETNATLSISIFGFSFYWKMPFALSAFFFQYLIFSKNICYPQHF